MLAMAACAPLEPEIIGREVVDAGITVLDAGAAGPVDAGEPEDAETRLDAAVTRAPDLVLAAVDPAPASWVPGSGRTFEITVRDLEAAAPQTTVRLELVDELDPAHRVELGVSAVPPLGPGGSVVLSVAAWIPAATAPGRYGVEATVDPEDNLREADEANNRRSAGAVWVSALEVSPGRFDFGVVGLGCTATQTLSLRNRGQSPAFFSTISPTDPTAPLRVVGAPAPPFALASGASLELSVVFAPAWVGAHQATVRLVHDQLGVPVELPATGAGADRPLRVERFVAWPARRVDVLVVVDDSPTMADDAAAIQGASGALVAHLEDLQVDFHIGVTTTDVSATGARGSLVGRTPLITPDTPQPAHTFAANLRVGAAGSEDERGLEAARLALTSNGAFRRPEAAIVVLWFSDEDDHGAEPAPELAEALLALTGPRGVRGWSARAVVSPAASPCPTAVGPGVRYQAAAEALSGAALPLCAFSWSAAVGSLVPDTLGRQIDFPLARTPLPGTLEVRVDGRVVAPLDAAGAERWGLVGDVVRFRPEAAPAPGAAVRISYRSGC